MRVGLVFGGHTTEGDVSRNTALNVRSSLERLGYEVINIEFDKDVAIHIMDANVDVVFNAMHGQYGEDGCLQGLLNIMKIPYTHSGLLPTAIAMNKKLSNQVFKDIGLNAIKGIVVSKQELLTDEWKDAVKNSVLKDCKELFVKPVCDGSSRDAYLVHDIEQFSFKNVELQTASNEFLIEERIIGREIQVAVVNNEAVGALEVIPNQEKSEFYDYKAKYSEDGAIHKIFNEEPTKQKLLEYAEKIHKTLGLRSVSRSEFLLTDKNEIYVLEVNSHPGLTQTSIVPEIALNKGISFDDLVEILLKDAKYD